MDIRNCKMCQKLFQYVNTPYCIVCARKVDDMYRTVKEYVYKHPNARIMDTSRETGVSEKYIMEFLREGRLILKKASFDLPCERCGVPIASGRLCKQCLKEFEQGMKSGLKPSTKSAVSQGRRVREQMHTAQYLKRK